MNRLTVTSAGAKNNKLTIRFDCEGQVGKFFLNTEFFCEYDTPIEKTPENTLIIPFLAAICPVAWVSQAEIQVKTVDETFLRSLEKVKNSLQKFYPRMRLGGSICVKKVSKPHVGVRSKRMMLFSGGVDSLASYVRHQTEKPNLVCVHGADVDLDNREAWNAVIEPVKEFAHKTTSTVRTVRSNFRSMLDSLMLGSYREYTAGDWWGRVMHGLALLGLCAPIAYVDKARILYIAASHTAEFSEPWGSHPDIDNNVSWTGTAVVHDGFKLSRQDKIEIIAEYIKNGDPTLIIRSCYESDRGNNCSGCEKCSRTIVGLELAGIDPNNHGFNVNADTFKSIRRNLMGGKWAFGENEQYMWEDLQHHASLDSELPHPEARDLVVWLLNTDLSTIRSLSRESGLRMQLSKFVMPLVRTSPPLLYRAIRKMYCALNKAFPPQ